MSPADQAPIRDGELIAAVDMGSNSFHVVVARVEHGEPRVIDRLRDTVRMAAGLRSDGTLDAERRSRALNCLARFGQRLAGLPSIRVRAVATNAVRRLASPQSFLTAAEAALGHPIEVVSGREEGRLIFLGAAHGLPTSREPRLVIDVGGG
ncbi:MAG: exopolyphosphatase, partial [Rhodanobacter sp.]|nr:exopolyphosphatase [Rhodanobacter sp.]